MRPVRMAAAFVASAEGSVLVEMGRTRVICTATVEHRVPRWRECAGAGWVTAEYGMLPASTGRRTLRPGPGRVNSRATEIGRLIGRTLRAGTDLAALGPNTVVVDCDVIEADGGTRTAAITGGWVALARAVDAARRAGRVPDGRPAVRDQVVAVSVGVVGGEARLDLCYAEDSAADVDLNVAMTANGRLIEVQATGEKATFSQAELVRLLQLARQGCRHLAEVQARARRKRER